MKVFVSLIILSSVATFMWLKYLSTKSVSYRQTKEPETEMSENLLGKRPVKWNDRGIDMSGYKVMILANTSELNGIDKIQNLLLTEGFVEVETSDSELGQARLTKVQHKTDLPDTTVERILTILDKEYYVTSEGSLRLDSEHDFVIILGKSRVEELEILNI